jgi:hypothetical protein
MGRRFQSGHSIVFPVPSILNGQDGGPRTILVVGKANTSAYQPILYTRSSGAHGWWCEVDTTGGFHVNYGTGTTARNCGTATVSTASIWTFSKDNSGSVHPFGRIFTGASFATDSGDVDSGLTLVDGTAIDTSYGVQVGRWGNTGTDYAADLEIYFIAVWNSVVAGSALAALTKTKSGIIAGSPDYWISFEGSTTVDSVSGSPTVTGTTAVSDPSGFFGSGGLTQALPVASETSTAQTFGRRKTRAVPVASETATAVVLGARKSRALAPAGETSSALAPVASKRRAVPVALEADSAGTLGGRKTRGMPVATETSSASTILPSKRRALPPAVETSTAQTFGTPEGGLVQALPTAVETSTARTIVGSKRAELPPAYEYSTAVTLAGGAPEGSGVMNLGAIMDEMAARLRGAPSLAGRTFAYPPGSIKAPAAIVTYPTDYKYDLTYGRGMDRITGEVVIVVGRPTERQTRDRITRYADGAGPESVKALLDGDAGDYVNCDSVTVSDALFDGVQIGGIDYLAVVFSVDIAGRGAQS